MVSLLSSLASPIPLRFEVSASKQILHFAIQVFDNIFYIVFEVIEPGLRVARLQVCSEPNEYEDSIGIVIDDNAAGENAFLFVKAIYPA